MIITEENSAVADLLFFLVLTLVLLGIKLFFFSFLKVLKLLAKQQNVKKTLLKRDVVIFASTNLFFLCHLKSGFSLVFIVLAPVF